MAKAVGLRYQGSDISRGTDEVGCRAAYFRWGLFCMPFWLVPVTRAVGQFDDPVFRGVVLRSLAWSFGCFVALLVGAIWAMHRLLAFHGWLQWVADILGSVGASLLAFWLFFPVAAGIGTLYCDRIASAVDRRFYPWLPVTESASMLEQAWDGVAVALRVLALSIVALVLALLIPGLGLLLGWMVAAYAIGRGMFVSVAMRRMPRAVAESLYRQRRGTILAQGAILALAAYIPALNLLIPVFGAAAMVHVLDMSISETSPSG
jgi:CysZ protein